MFKTLTALSFLFTFGVQAQNWQLFPQDSLRAFEVLDYDGQPYLKGMDFRTYATRNNITEVRLDSFSHLRFLDYDWSSMYFGRAYITGNSALGHHITITPTHTTLYFVSDYNKKEITDSFLLKQNEQIGSSWLCFENATVQVIATLTKDEIRETPNGQDSTRTIQLRASRKDNPSRAFVYDIVYGKKYGIINGFDFDSLRKHNQINRFTETITFLPYTEYTEKSFFTIQPNTEMHDYTVSGDSYISKSIYKQQKYYYDQSDIRYNEKKKTVNTDYQTNEQTEVYDSSEAVLYVPLKTSNAIFNPIPTTYNADKKRIQRLCNNQGYRVKTTEVFSQSILLSEDTLAFDREYELEAEYNSTYVQGVGLESSYYRSGPKGLKTYSRDLAYIKTSTCELGNKLSIFASISGLEKKFLTIYPNPASDFIYIDNPILFTSRISLLNSLGQECTVIKSKNSIQVSHLARGLYLLQVIEGDVLYQAKFIKN